MYCCIVACDNTQQPPQTSLQVLYALVKVVCLKEGLAEEKVCLDQCGIDLEGGAAVLAHQLPPFQLEVTQRSVGVVYGD